MPAVRTARLRYVEKVSLTLQGGAINKYIFRANSCADPNQTSTGHTPMGWDQWKALYNHYVVSGAKISVTATHDADDSNARPYRIGCYISDSNTTAYSDANSFIEAKKGTWKHSGLNTKVARVKSFYSCKNFFNVKDVKDNLDRLGAPVGSNPGDVAFFHIWAEQDDINPVNFTYLTFNVIIDYIVKFSEPIDIAPST